ncbi:hypothetical protein FPOA_13747 [Fusarium poae]|uniref:C2H2-type domain-containing protein n=1 Tax=Fusarium poae TaxID=36050 RepID=A0A1B8A4L6_FUSPO|nr:hypothetical protein FPOA_13747 [Fusarium poae]
MAIVQQVNEGSRTKTNTDKEKPLATFDPVAFDSIIYRQSRLCPPPGVRLSPRIVKYRSQHWYKQKCEETKRRPRRKAWFGKVQARLRWVRAEKERLEQSRQNAQNDGTTPPFEPPEPRCFKQILDFGDVPEKDLPEHVRNNPAWLKTCAWLRKCEEENTQYPRKVDKLGKKPERYSAEGETNHVNRFNRMEGIEHHDRESTNTPVNDTTTDDASEILTPHSSQSRVRPPQAVPSSATRHTTYEIISPSSEPYDPMNNYGSSESVRTPLGSEHAYDLQQHQPYNLRRRQNTHNKEKTYECNHEGCNKRFTSSYKRKQHQKFHTGEMPYECDNEDCHKCFTTIPELTVHRMRHTGEIRYECNHEGCNKSFKTLSNLRQHQKTHNKRRPYRCDDKGCTMSFKTLSNLRHHQKTHNEERPYRCDDKGCTMSFKTPYELKRHQSTHPGEKSYKCDNKDCNKGFTTLSTLRQHQKTHNKERPYRCDDKGCNKSFKTPYELKRHQSTHPGEKSYKCDNKDCNKGFTTLSTLRQHQKTHNEERPYRCDDKGCNKSFKTLSNLRQHQEIHTRKE